MSTNEKYSRNICVATNTSCNLNCIYCYEKRKTGKSFDVDDTLQALTSMLKETTPYGTKIKLHGGEPFIEYGKIKFLCENLWSEELEENFKIHITTNGTLIHGEVQDWLRKHKDRLALKLSLDGDKISNDQNRPKSYDLIDIPFFVETWPDIRVNMTITPQTIQSVDTNIKHLHSLGFNNILVNFALLTDWSCCNKEKIFYRKLLKLATFYLQNPQIRPVNLFRFDISRTIDHNGVFFSPCNIGTKTAYDLETKKYYPCHMFFPSVCGEQMEERLSEIDFTKRDNLVSNSCKACPFLNLCRTCYADNFICRGSLCERDMSLCIYQKIVFVILFKFEYAKITSVDNPTSDDYQRMKAICQWSDYIDEIESQIM